MFKWPTVLTGEKKTQNTLNALNRTHTQTYKSTNSIWYAILILHGTEYAGPILNGTRNARGGGIGSWFRAKVQAPAIRPQSGSPSYYSLIFKKGKHDIETTIQQSYEGASVTSPSTRKELKVLLHQTMFMVSFLTLRFGVTRLHVEVCNLTAVLDEETGDIKNPYYI